MSSSFAVGWIVASTVLCVGLVAGAAERPLPQGARVLDSDALLYGRPNPTVSPDGKWIAYVSQGYICVCNIEKPAPRRIMEVPNSFTWLGFKAPAGRSPATGSFPSLARGLENDQYRELYSQVTNTIEGLNWTRSSDGFVFGTMSFDEKTRSTFGSGYFATVEGKISPISRIEPNSATRGLIVGDFTHDRSCLVGKSMISVDTRRWGPLIWDIERNRPRATPYLYLVPSSSSGRWIGIEKDTRQLVILDEQLQVARRFDERLPDQSYGFELDWSPDERFVIWRNQIGFDHYSNWEGFRLNLTTQAKRSLQGRFMDEQTVFTGTGGEFVRCGQDGERMKRWIGDVVTGAHLTIVPEGFGPGHDVWRIVAGSDQIGNFHGYPSLWMSPDAKLFAIALPQPLGERMRFVWHLMEPAGKAWRFPGEENGEFESPYELAGFAIDGSLIVCYDAKRIFTIPVASIVTASNEDKSL
jgi:WD40-like Beta Propeller Repeat